MPERVARIIAGLQLSVTAFDSLLKLHNRAVRPLLEALISDFLLMETYSWWQVFDFGAESGKSMTRNRFSHCATTLRAERECLFNSDVNCNFI